MNEYEFLGHQSSVAFKKIEFANLKFKKSLYTRFSKTALIMMLCIHVSACAGGLTANTRERAQSVFRYHNQLVSQLILHYSEPSLTDSQLAELEQAEVLMIKACKPLNQVAANVRDGHKAGVKQRLNVPRALSRCKKQTNAVEQLLAKF